MLGRNNYLVLPLLVMHAERILCQPPHGVRELESYLFIACSLAPTHSQPPSLDRACTTNNEILYAYEDPTQSFSINNGGILVWGEEVHLLNNA